MDLKFSSSSNTFLLSCVWICQTQNITEMRMFVFGKREKLFTFNTSTNNTATAMRGMCTCPAVRRVGFLYSEETTEFPASKS